MLIRQLCVLTLVFSGLTGTVQEAFATDRWKHAAARRAHLLAERSRYQQRLRQSLGIRRAEISSQQAASTAEDIPGSQFVPYIVQGHGWSTSLDLINTCSEASHYRIRFYDSTGTLKELYTGNESGTRMRSRSLEEEGAGPGALPVAGRGQRGRRRTA